MVSTKRALKLKQKSFFIIFKGLSVVKKSFRPENLPLIGSILKAYQKKYRKRKIREVLEIKKSKYNKKIKVLNRDENNQKKLTQGQNYSPI